MSSSDSQSNGGKTARILVIGAGVAGLSAAAELNRRGYTNVKVFEARSRLGGRVHTFAPKSNSSDPPEGQPVIELGAQWIHGQKDNSVFEICSEEKESKDGIQDLLDMDASSFTEKFFYWQQLTENQNEYMAHLVETFEKVLDDCVSQSNAYVSGERNEEVALSLEAFVESRFKEMLEEETDPDKQKMLRWYFDWGIRFENEINAGEAKEVSANYFGQYHECEGNATTELGPRGYKAFIDLLLKDIPVANIFMENEVTHIDYSVRPVKVTSTLGIEEFDHVISCFPLGVLKERKSHLFTPELPLLKTEAIDALGFGTCNKIYLEFAEEDVFWKPGDVFQILWTDKILLPSEVAVLDDHTKRQRKWYHSIDRLNAVRNNEQLLVAWVAGAGAREMEAVPENEVIDQCCKILTMVTGRQDLRRPERIIRSTWYSDPFSRGSYSFISTNCDRHRRSIDQMDADDALNPLLPATLAKPILIDNVPILCFAGEATSDHFYSTVHGAYDSGYREADRIANYLRHKVTLDAKVNDDSKMGPANMTGNFSRQPPSDDSPEGAKGLRDNADTQMTVCDEHQLSTAGSVHSDELKWSQAEITSDQISKCAAKINKGDDASVIISAATEEGQLNSNCEKLHSKTGQRPKSVDLRNEFAGGDDTTNSTAQTATTPNSGNQFAVGQSNSKASISLTTPSPNSSVSYSPKACEHFRVIIVGAGAAGLGAALQLLDLSSQNELKSEDLLVVEAHSRPGGRIRTCYEVTELVGGPLEFGAQWVHGEEDNALFEFCQQHNLLSDPCEDYSVEGKGVFLLPDGSAVPEELIERNIMVLDGVKEELAKLNETSEDNNQGNPLGYKSVFDMYRRRFEAHLVNSDSGIDNSGLSSTLPNIPELMSAILDWYRKFEIVDNACKDPDQMAIRGYGDYVECPGVYYINFRNGYESFVQTAIKFLPEQSLCFNSPVSKIIWRDELENRKIVTVEMSDGRLLTCDHLILTPSVRILSKFAFEPRLPKFKHEALRCFGFDAIDKLFLVWDEGPFWSEDTLGFQFLWTQYDDAFFKEHGEYLRGIYGFEKVNQRPNVLLGWIGGEDAVQMEKIPDDELLQGCYHLLKRFADRVIPAGVPFPSRVIRSEWASDPYIQGAYSHRLLAFDQTEDPVGKLQEPLYHYIEEAGTCIDSRNMYGAAIGSDHTEDRKQKDEHNPHPLVLFAGEATDPTYFSTVHGALRSGRREAQRLIDFWNSQSQRSSSNSTSDIMNSSTLN